MKDITPQHDISEREGQRVPTVQLGAVALGYRPRPENSQRRWQTAERFRTAIGADEKEKIKPTDFRGQFLRSFLSSLGTLFSESDTKTQMADNLAQQRNSFAADHKNHAAVGDETDTYLSERETKNLSLAGIEAKPNQSFQKSVREKSVAPVLTAGQMMDELAREISDCICQSRRVRSGQWKISLRLKEKIIPDTALRISSNGYSLEVALHTMNQETFEKLRSHQKNLEDALNQKTNLTVSTYIKLSEFPKEA
jgi:hypothetical protein